MEDAIKEANTGVTGHSTTNFHNGPLSHVVEAVARIFDDALGGFRIPIRSIEKVRKFKALFRLLQSLNIL